MHNILITILGNTKIEDIAISFLLAFVLGIGLCISYIISSKKDGYGKSFIMTITTLPVIMCAIIMMVGDNITRAFSLAGIFTLVRFRLNVTSTKDITYIFVTLAIGMATGLGYNLYALLITIILASILMIIGLIKFETDKQIRLKIVLPEDLNYVGAFDEIFERYLKKNRLIKVKTTDFGALIELTFMILLKDMNDSKKLIDELRVKNGNLNIMMTSDYQSEERFIY